ncbi:MAG: hypothetical protein ACKVRP_03315 [Bacteroidota bacterium]
MDIKKLIEDFSRLVDSVEISNGQQFHLFRDDKTGAFFIDCHILASSVTDLLDYEASLDPDEQEDLRANRELNEFHRLFLRMKDDAKRGRQFNDIIVEYLPSSEDGDLPIKIYGGQHRSKSIEEAQEAGVDKYHGFRVYFGLTKTQRGEIAETSNSNINVPIDLFTRMQETTLGPELRNWCKAVGFPLTTNEDFAENKNADGIVTARLARMFVVNFMNGKHFKSDFDQRALTPFAGNDVNDIYLKLNAQERKTLFEDQTLLAAGESFAMLHRTQMEKVKKDKALSRNNEFKTKALTPSVISAWACAAGLLQKDNRRLAKLYSLPKNAKKTDPLSANIMSDYKHHSDKKTYRGLGTRSDKRERGRLAEVFLVYSQKEEKYLTAALIDLAVSQYHTKLSTEDVRKKAAKVK